jgi:hypothetical protein
MNPISNDVIRFVPFVPAFSTITVRIGINPYFLAFYLNGAKGVINFRRQFTGINPMHYGTLKTARFIKMVEEIDQDIYQLFEVQATPEMTQLSMIRLDFRI